MPSFLMPDAGLLFWMLIAFVSVFVLLAKFGFPVIVKMVEERKQFIDESLRNAREANERLSHIQLDSEALLREARDKQAQILREAAAMSDTIVQEARNKAQTEGLRLLEEAKRQIVIEKEAALQELRAEVADLSVRMAEKVLRRQLEDQAEQRALINRLLEDVSVSQP